MANDSKKLYLRYLIIIALIGLVCVAILLRAGRTMIVEGEAWRQKIGTLRYDTVPILAERGDILAADGRLLATTMPLYTMYIDMEVVQRNRDTFEYYLDDLCRALAQMPGDRSAEAYRRHLLAGFTAKHKRNYRLSYAHLSYSQKQQVLTYPFFNRGNSYKTGFMPSPATTREHPFGIQAMATIGRVYAELSKGGSSGIELQYDSLLRGLPGRQVRLRVGDKILEPSEPGKDIVTTLDVDIQDMAESALMDKLIETGADYGVAVIMEVETGAIRAIANLDRNSQGLYVEGVNHAVSDFIEPGSTFKTAAMMVALDAGVVTPDEIFDTGNGLFHYAGRDMKDHNYNKGGYHKITAAQSIWYSSNIGISKIILKGFEKDPKKFVDGLYAIGLNKKVDLQLPGALAPRIKYPVLPDGSSNSEWWKTSLPWMSFGYEVSIPPIYTLMFYNAIANGGKMIKPYIVSGISEDGKMIQKFGTEVVNPQICKPQTLQEIRQMLVDVVQHGTARGKDAVSSDYVQIAGKTGTAQIHQGDAAYKGNSVRHRVSFCGYFPADKPKYSGIVVISNPKGYPSGGTMPGAVLRRIAEQLYARGFLPSDNSLARDTATSRLPYVKNGSFAETKQVCDVLSLPCSQPVNDAEWTKITSTGSTMKAEKISVGRNIVPSVTGMGAVDAVYLLESAGLHVEIEGSGKVVRQSLPAGRRVYKGENIQIVLR